jgi:hypothetical protein
MHPEKWLLVLGASVFFSNAAVADEYQHDAGTSYAATVTIVRGGPWIEETVPVGFFQWYNERPGFERITALSFGWGGNTYPPPPSHDGQQFFAGVWDDIDDDPATYDLRLISQTESVITGSLDWDLMTVDIPDVTISGLFYIGAIVDIPFAQSQPSSANWLTSDVFHAGSSLFAYDLDDPEHPLSSALEVNSRQYWWYLRGSAVPGPSPGLCAAAASILLVPRRRRRT